MDNELQPLYVKNYLSDRVKGSDCMKEITDLKSHMDERERDAMQELRMALTLALPIGN